MLRTSRSLSFVVNRPRRPLPLLSFPSLSFPFLGLGFHLLAFFLFFCTLSGWVGACVAGEASGLSRHRFRRLRRRRDPPQKLRGRGGDDRPDPGGGRGPQALRAGAADAGAFVARPRGWF